MHIITKSLRVINYEQNCVFPREIPSSFDEYVLELIAHINNNTSVRNYKTDGNSKEVIRCIIDIYNGKTDVDLVINKMNTIAKRLLDKEIDAQHRVERLSTNVQKGSLIQALLYDEADNTVSYLLAKVEHSDFVDDTDFTFKSGFSKDKKNIWKSCLIDISDIDSEYFLAKVYTNNVAKYWSNDFLELEELVSDEKNTITAFKAIDGALSSSIKKSAPNDYTVIRNSFISYFKNHTHFDYDQMLESQLLNYQPTDLEQDKLDLLIDKLKKLPEKKHFDKQFTTIPSAIKAHIKKVYDVNQGVKIQITDEIQDIANTIIAYRENDGEQYIRIKSTNNETYNLFYRRQ